MDGNPAQFEDLSAPACAAEIARIREPGVLGKAGRLRDLFDYLVERSLKDDPPKEIEIISAVFSSGGSVTPEDSVARVYVHRLRKRLEDHFARTGGSSGVRLLIPRGEYRVVAQRVAAKSPTVGRPRRAAALLARAGEVVRRRALTAGVAAALAILLLGNVVAWTGLAGDESAQSKRSVAAMDVWAPLAKSEAPLLIVVGDYYMFGEYEDRLFLTRLIRDFSINSKEDLVEHYLTSPAAFDRYGDVALQYLPTSTAYALADLSPLLVGRDVRVTLASELTETQIKENDIIYVGLISGLGKLKGPVFTASRFAVGESYDIIEDTSDGRFYTSEAFLGAPSESMYRDYGLFKSFSGPTGRRIFVLAGARDTALMGLSETLTDPDAGPNLASISAEEFESLFEVQGRKHVNLEARQLAAQSVNSEDIWSSSPNDMPVFPTK